MARAKSKTPPQNLQGVSTISGPQPLYQPARASYSTYRRMKTHPTVALARSLSAAAVLAGSWSVEATDNAPEGAVEFISDRFIDSRPIMLAPILMSSIDYGWSASEIIYNLDENNRTIIEHLKPLIPDLSLILVDSQTGDFAGIRQNYNGPTVDLMSENVLYFALGVEGQNFYGTAPLNNSLSAWNDWNEANNGAALYSKKIAGSHWVIRYPLGKSIYLGTETDNSEIADRILSAMLASGSVKIPNTIAQYVEDLAKQNYQWSIELLEDAGGKEANFNDRLRYLDSLMVRGLLLPERVVLEGQSGSRAEASVQTDTALMTQETRAKLITEAFNRQCVDRLMLLNWGLESVGSVYLTQQPLIDQDRAFLRDVYKLALANPGSTELQTIDFDSMKNQLSVPKSEITSEVQTNAVPE